MVFVNGLIIADKFTLHHLAGIPVDLELDSLAMPVGRPENSQIIAIFDLGEIIEAPVTQTIDGSADWSVIANTIRADRQNLTGSGVNANPGVMTAMGDSFCHIDPPIVVNVMNIPEAILTQDTANLFAPQFPMVNMLDWGLCRCLGNVRPAYPTLCLRALQTAHRQGGGGDQGQDDGACC